MDDDPSASTDGKSLTNLRVIDLKQELEKRGLSKSGSKKDLVKRLKQQIEFEKLCEERKSTGGDHDLKLELDAVTEQNEFVQQYLAQQQKIYAEQQEVKRLVELEEIQKSGDERESCEADSLGEENEEKSVSSSETEEQNKNECSEKCDTTSGESAEPSSSETFSERNSDDFIHIEVLQEESLTNTRSKVCDSLQESVITSMVRHKKRSSGSNVPYSISEIQLPDSPGECLKSVSKHKASEDKDKIEVEPVVIQKFGGSEDCEMTSNVATHVQADKNIKKDRDQQDRGSTDPVRDSSSFQNSKSDKPILNKEIKEKFAEVSSNEDESQNVILQKKFDIENVDSNENQLHRSKRNSNLNESDTESETKSPQSKMEVEQDNELEKETTSRDNRAVKHTLVQHIEDEKDTTSQDNETGKSSESDDQTDSMQTKSHIVRKRSKRKSSESSSQSSDSSPERKVYAKHGEDFKSQSLTCRVTKDSKSPESQNSVETKESKSPDSQNSKEIKESKSPISQNSEDTKESSVTLSNESVPVTKIKNNEEKLSLPVSISSRRLKLKRNNIAILENKKIETQIKNDSSQSESMDTRIEEAPQKELDKSESEPEHSQEKRKPSHEKIKPPQDKHEPSQEKHKPSHEKIKPPQDKHGFSQEKPEPSKEKPEPSEEKPEPSEEKLETSMEKLETSQEEPEPSQEKPNSPEKLVELIMPKMTNRKLSILSRKLNRKSSEEDKSEEAVLKKSRWGSYTSSLSRNSISISSDSLKKFIPDFKLITAPISANDMDDPFNPVFPSEPSPVATEPKLPNFTIAKEIINEEAMEENSKLVVSKQLPVKKEHETEQRQIKCPSPHGPVSKIVFIQNLVRPFTLLQLKELLRQTGNMVEESFWTDRIKSKCFVEYETEEEALKTREALNGARWPSSNPKILSVEFATQEELDQLKNGSEGPHAMSQRQIPALTEVRDTRTVLALPVDNHRKKERDHRKEAIKTKPQLPMREWDKDKISQETPERERGISSGRERERGSRSVEKKDKKDSKRRTNEDTPAKLLDDLFQKTKSSPCIYWLPLTEEQVKQKEEDRRLRVLAREKKNQQKDEEAAATTTTNRRTRTRPPQKSHDKESRRSQTRSRSPVTRRR